MIVYNENYQLIGMEKRALEILGYDDLDDFLSKYKDIDDIADKNYKKNDPYNFLQGILKSKNGTKKIRIHTKNNDLIAVTFKAQTIFLERFKKLYKLDMIVENIDNGENSKNQNQNADLRLPMLQRTKNVELVTHSSKTTLIDERWLESTRSFLHLEKDEFIGYLKIFIQNVRKNDISIQSAVMTYNSLGIKKTIARLKEPATNLHLTPLVRIYTNIQNSSATDLSGLILSAKDFINELDELIKKYEGNL